MTHTDLDGVPPPPQPDDDKPDHSWPAVSARLHVLWNAARVVLGVVLCVAGVLGTLLPIIPGVPLIIAGVALLGSDHWLVRPVAQRVERWRNGRS